MVILVYLLTGFVLGVFVTLKTFPQQQTVINSPDIKIKNSAGASATENLNVQNPGFSKPKKGFILFRPFKKKKQ